MKEILIETTQTNPQSCSLFLIASNESGKIPKLCFFCVNIESVEFPQVDHDLYTVRFETI